MSSTVLQIGAELFLYLNCSIQATIGLGFVVDPPRLWCGKRCKEARILGLAFLMCAFLSMTASRGGTLFCPGHSCMHCACAVGSAVLVCKSL